MSASMTYALLATSEPVLTAAESESSSSDAFWLVLLGPIAGVTFYTVTYLRYRNIDKRHEYERETACVVANPVGHDHKTGDVNDVENDRLSGANEGSPRSRLGDDSSWSEQ